jgi:hypothetical protein
VLDAASRLPAAAELSPTPRDEEHALGNLMTQRAALHVDPRLARSDAAQAQG